MVMRIVSVSMLFFCLVAIGLSLSGFTHVDLGVPFMSFMHSVNRDLQTFKIEIPDIPLIPRYERQSEGGDDIISVLINVLNALIFIANMFVNTINMIATIINTLIQLIQFIFIVLRNLITFKDSVHATPSPSIPVV